MHPARRFAFCDSSVRDRDFCPAIEPPDLERFGNSTRGRRQSRFGRFAPVAYGVRAQDHLIDYDEAAEVARANNPKVIIAGGSAYSRQIDFKKFREIADEVGAIQIATTVARAQSGDPIGDLLSGASPDSVPNTSPSRAQTVARPLSASDQSRFAQGLAAARRGDVSRARDAISTISDRVARKTVLWALVDTSASSMSFGELDAARRDLEGFPRPARRQIAAERALASSGKSPRQIVDWFDGAFCILKGQIRSPHGCFAAAELPVIGA
eukprot:gene36652-49395_t